MPVASVGDVASAERTITTEDVEDYAALVGDRNPLHLDPGYAAEGLFGGVVAHGMLAAGVVSAALASLSGDIVYVAQDLSFEAPVRPGETVTAEVTVQAALGGDRLRVETTAATDEVVLTGEAVVLSVPHGGDETDGSDVDTAPETTDG